MNIVRYLKEIVNKFKRRNNPMLLDSPKRLYSNLMKDEKISSILENMPENLSDMERAYYIYIELAKILNENPEFVFASGKNKERHYNDKIDERYYGICKSISELYVGILAKIGIQAELVKKYPGSPMTHVDTILKINGKNYIANLISDLGRAKTGNRINSFGYNLGRKTGNSIVDQDNRAYLSRLEKYYGKIDYITRSEIEKLDKKLGYSFFVPRVTLENERGIYTEDTLELLKKDFDNPEDFREFVLHGEDVPEEELLKYKLDYVCENINKFTEKDGKMEYLESIRYYMKIAQKLLTPEELRRIDAYAAVRGNNLNDIISILKVKPLNPNENRGKGNIYYVYSTEDSKYKRKTPEEMKEFVDGVDKNSLRIVGMFDRYRPQDIEELEL